MSRTSTATAAAKAQHQGTIAVVPGREEKVIEYVPFGGLPKDKIKLTMGIVRDLVAAKTKSGKVPTDRQIINFMMLCKSRLLNPFEGDAFLVGYDTNDGPVFNLITSIQAFLKRAAMSKDFDGMDSGVIVKDAQEAIVNREGDFCLESDTLVGAWAIVHFKNKSHPMKERISLNAYRKKFGRWLEDPAGMLVKCAEHSALRKAFPAMMLDMSATYEEPITHEEQDGLPMDMTFMPNGARNVITDAQEAKLNAAIAEHNASAQLIGNFYGLQSGQRLLAAEFEGCLAKIRAGDFSGSRENGGSLAEGELGDDELRELSADEIDAAIREARADAAALLKRFGVKRAADLTQAQRGEIMAELAQTVSA
jgi:phage recombination protein Bet